MIIFEAFVFDESKLPERQDKSAELFLGRMQPVHIGHKKIIDSMKNPFIAIVKGSKSSEDKSKNPLDFNEQKRLLKKISNAQIIEVSVGYIPEIIKDIRLKGFEVDVVYAGADRIEGYKKQIDAINKKLEDNKQIKVTFKETERVTSATTVRTAIRSGDAATFKKVMPKELHNEFDHLRKLLAEEVTGTSNVAATDLPITSKKLKNKTEYVDEILKRKPQEK